MKTSFRSQAYKISTRIAAVIGIAGAVACFALVAMGGDYPEYKHGTSIVAPHAGETWQVGELHTVQWTLDGVRATDDKGENITAVFMLSYSGGGTDGHVLLGEISDWFPISDRFANIMVPSVPTRDDYTLYLFSREDRDISSWSGPITIFNPDNVDGSDEPPSSLVVTTAPPVSVTKSLTSTFLESSSTSNSALLTLPTVDVGSLTSALSLSLSLPLSLPISSTNTIASNSATSVVTLTSSSSVSSAFPTTALSSSSSVVVQPHPTTDTEQPAQTSPSAADRMKRERRR
ncbi:hypothetical protein BD310DRAFT_849445 [Dichomitus squalens]|uniref:Uncharacterized protein n=1 Tax=Dichomitus squalens TaxID=114155 RepID=A0A4Q9PX30_9APHY|nr:hypothetical protein BD310DRAFT_849445 [Dichomitus squalens]